MMNLMRYNKAGNVFDLMGSFFSDYPVMSEVENEYAPLVDIYEKEDKFFIEAQLPGVKKEDVKIELDKNNLFISAERNNKREMKKENYYRKEIVSGKFSRSFILPESVNKDSLEAKFEDGILKIELPKLEVRKPKQINIS